NPVLRAFPRGSISGSRMRSRCPRSPFVRHGIAAFLILASLASTVRGQAADPPPAPASIETGAAIDRGETEASSEQDEIEDFIETDRNSFTSARLTAGDNRLIVESSYSFIDIPGQKTKNSFPELLMRYGIGDRFELRLGWNYETGRERVPGAGSIAGFF